MDQLEFQEEGGKKKLPEISWLSILKVKGSFFALMLIFIVYYADQFYASFLAIEIVKMGLKDYQIGFFWATQSIPYFFLCPIYAKLLEKSPKRILFVICLAIVGLSYGVMGPSELFMLPKGQYHIVAVGFIMQGVIEPLIFIFAFPEAVERFYYEHGIREGDDPEFDCKISDQFGTLCTFITSLSCLFSPFIGSLTY